MLNTTQGGDDEQYGNKLLTAAQGGAEQCRSIPITDTCYVMKFGIMSSFCFVHVSFVCLVKNKHLRPIP